MAEGAKGQTTFARCEGVSARVQNTIGAEGEGTEHESTRTMCVHGGADCVDVNTH